MNVVIFVDESVRQYKIQFMVCKANIFYNTFVTLGYVFQYDSKSRGYKTVF